MGFDIGKHRFDDTHSSRVHFPLMRRIDFGHYSFRAGLGSRNVGNEQMPHLRTFFQAPGSQMAQRALLRFGDNIAPPVVAVKTRLPEIPQLVSGAPVASFLWRETNTERSR
jgi:hypothetical protein